MQTNAMQYSLVTIATMVTVWIVVFTRQSTGTDVESASFAQLEKNNGPLAALFYHSSNSEHEPIKKALKRFRLAARKVDKLWTLNEYSTRRVRFYVCDGDAPENIEKFKSAAFDRNVAYVFTTTPENGIEKYSLPMTSKLLTRHIALKMGGLTFNEQDVLSFTDEDRFYERMDRNEDKSQPTFVKFFEQWCQHCQRLKNTFARAATYFKSSQIDFVKVECSKSEATKSFCNRHDAKSFPKLILFTGETTINYDDAMRDIVPFERFFSKHIANFSSLSSSSSGIDKKSLTKKAEKPEIKIKPRHNDPQSLEDMVHVLLEKMQHLETKIDNLTQMVRNSTRSPIEIESIHGHEEGQCSMSGTCSML